MTKRLKRNLRAHGSQAGVALAEFALVLPVLVVLLFGIVDFGKALNYWNDETHLANEAARFAAVDKDPTTLGDGSFSTLQDFISSEADSNELREGGTNSVPDAIKVCIGYPDGTDVGDRVVAKVTTTYNFFGFLFSGAADHQVNGSATMRLEQSPDTAAIPDNLADCG